MGCERQLTTSVPHLTEDSMRRLDVPVSGHETQ
jgi:hypothetical protein